MIMTEKERTRFREQNICNLAYGEYWSGNDYGIPEMLPERIEGIESTPLKSFNYAKGLKDSGVGIHFFLHDYQFERVWNRPEQYVELLKKFQFVLSPDFSPYNDMPRALQVYNVYRNRWCGRYWQENGIKVIPTVTWSSDDTLDFCLCGVPKHSTIAVSTMGEGRWAKFSSLKRNWNKMLEVLEPKQILLYGKDLSKELKGNIVHKKITSLEGMKERLEKPKEDVEEVIEVKEDAVFSFEPKERVVQYGKRK